LRHRTDVSDSHPVSSHPVSPVRPIAVSAACPSPDPCTVTHADPVPPPFARTMLVSVLTSYETCCDIMLPLAAIVMEANSVLPALIRVSLHASDVYDSHSLASHAVTPSPALGVHPSTMPSPSMVNVLLALDVRAWLETCTRDNSGPPYVKLSVSDPALSCSVATKLNAVDTPEGDLLTTLVPDTHTVLSHAVNPKRAFPVYVDMSPSIVPVPVKISPPPGYKFTAIFNPPTEDKDTRSTLSALLVDPICTPDVTETP
jgi:hypothetical protein